MNSIYIGDRPIDPPEDPDECKYCEGHGVLFFRTESGGVIAECCKSCGMSMRDPGEPNEEPDL